MTDQERLERRRASVAKWRKSDKGKAWRIAYVAPPRECRADNCARPVLARELCNKHYIRWRNHGDHTITLNDRDMSPEDRRKRDLARDNESRRQKYALNAAYRARVVGRVRDRSNAGRTGSQSGGAVYATVVSYGECAYCGDRDSITMDHFIPVKSGGQHTLGNGVPCCFPCNSSKRNHEAYAWMISKHGPVAVASFNRYLEWRRARKILDRSA